MKIQPVRGRITPRYPTHVILDAHPELLRLLPRRWRRNALVLAAVTAVGTLAIGCRSQNMAALAQPGETSPPPPASHVAPIFQHGDGHGFFGGIGSNTYLLPEDEARKLIAEEARRAGISFTADAQQLANFSLPLTRMDSPGGEKKPPAGTRTEALVLDGADTTRHIAYEYISQQDFKAWLAKDGGPYATAWGENYRATATTLRDAIATAKPAGAYAVFYDPTVKLDPQAVMGTPAVFSERTLAPLNVFQLWTKKPLAVSYDEKTGVISIAHDGTKITLTVGSATTTVNGREEQMPVPVRLHHGTPYLPLQWTSETLGFPARWNTAKKEVHLRLPSMDNDWTSAVYEMTLNDTGKPASVAFGYLDQRAKTALATDAAREELRNQVKDFITWLKAEGVI